MPASRREGLLVKAARGVAIPLVPPCQRKRRQPALAADDPALVRRRQLIGGIERSEIHFDLIFAASENRRAAAGTEEPPLVFTRLAVDHHRTLREDRGRVEQRAMKLA